MSSSWEGYTLSNTFMLNPRFHRCSLMVKVLCVWYYSWSGGSIFEPRFCKKQRFSQILSFRMVKRFHRHIMVLFLVRREHLWKSLPPFCGEEGYTLSNTCMVKPRFHRCSLMVKVLCVWYYSWSGGSIFEPRFCKKHNFHKFSVFVKRYILRSKKVFLPKGLYLIQHCVWWSLGSIDVPWW